jgi:23S rRNA (cytidine1920-2'-O)/16S rRNA (cytidine1409-2'-O)-methyltransferase
MGAESDVMSLGKVRLDQALVTLGLAVSRERGQALIRAGLVRVNGMPVHRAAELVDPDAVEVNGGKQYASRGGDKLAHALDAFGLDPAGRSCLDVGASTGGFTDVLLRRGASHVIALDVGYGQLDWALRRDPRVTVLDRTNVRTLEHLPHDADLAVVDVSFISLRLVLPAVARLLSPPKEIVALVKPQFEVGRGRVGKGGIVKDPLEHRRVLSELKEFAREIGYSVVSETESPILGAKGNREFFLHLRPAR